MVKVYWSWNNGSSVGGVERVDPDGSNREKLPNTSTNYPAGVDVDPSTGKVYYTLAGGWDIRNCDLDGGDNQMIIANGGYYFRGISLDVVGGKMYWAAGHNSTNAVKQILRANLNGSSMQYLYEPADLTNETVDVSLDLTNGNVYWTDFGSRDLTTDGAIGYGSLDGTATAVVTHVGGDPQGVVVDPAAGKVYWTNKAGDSAGAGGIYSANLDLTGVTSVVSGLTGPKGLTLDTDAGKLYWSDASSGGSIRRADATGGGTIETLTTNIGRAASDLALLHDNIPAGWTAEDVGSPTKEGYTVHHEPTGRFVVESASSDIWNSNDEFQYVHQTHNTGSEDFTAMVRLWSQEDTHDWAKAGLMARDGTNPDAAFAMTVGTPGQGVRLQWRDSGGSEATNQLAGSPNTAKDGAAPVWLILRRRGDEFSSYYAEDVNGQPGVWSGKTTQTVALPANVEIGMAVSSHSAAVYGTGIFDNVKVGNWGPPQAQFKLADDGKFSGVAYALDDFNGDGTLADDEVADVNWKIERVKPAQGLLGQWFMGKTTRNWDGSPDYRIVTDTIDRNSFVYPQEVMDAQGLSPGDDLNYFAVKYSGQVYADHDGTFAFRERVDDVAMLYIDGQRLLSNSQWDVHTSDTVSLTEGWHDIEFYTWEGGAGDMAHLEWDPTGGSAWVAVPEDVLRFSLVGDGTWAIGDPNGPGLFDDVGPLGPPGWYRLTVDYMGEQAVSLYNVPEPSSLLLLSIGIGLLLVRKRRG